VTEGPTSLALSFSMVKRVYKVFREKYVARCTVYGLAHVFQHHPTEKQIAFKITIDSPVCIFGQNLSQKPYRSNYLVSFYKSSYQRIRKTTGFSRRSVRRQNLATVAEPPGAKPRLSLLLPAGATVPPKFGALTPRLTAFVLPLSEIRRGAGGRWPSGGEGSLPTRVTWVDLSSYSDSKSLQWK
jgi:hypothetical protein